MELEGLVQNLSQVADLYAKRFDIERTPDWYLIKIQEELGELSSAYLKLSGRARLQDESNDQLRKNLEDELADVLAMTLLFAKSQGVDASKALQQKWYQYLDQK